MIKKLKYVKIVLISLMILNEEDYFLTNHVISYNYKRIIIN